MTEEVLNKIEELMNKCYMAEIKCMDEHDEMYCCEFYKRMGLYALLQEYGYDYNIDENGKIKVIKEEE